MNRITTLLLALLLVSTLFFESCKKDNNDPLEPEKQLTADFSFSNDNCEAPCIISFTNLSENAVSYIWDLGDNNTSTDKNPAHSYSYPGDYTVQLTASDQNGKESSSSKSVTIAGTYEFITGMDLSYQSFLEDFDVKYYDEDGDAIDDFFQFVSDNGVNMIRVRLFHSPQGGSPVVQKSGLPDVLDLCQKIKASGNKIMLDIHYSDTWADPGHQNVPSAWDELSFEVLKDSIYQYTKYVLETLNSQNTLPDMVQIGNETNSGFLWDYGKVWNEFDNNWGNYAGLINSASKAIQEIEQEVEASISTIVHIAGVTNKEAFFDKLLEQNANFDVIGLSHYAHWHTRDLNLMQNELNDLADKYNKPVMIVETSYPFTLDWNDWTNNVVGSEDHLIAGYPASPEGQKAYYEKMVEILKNVPGGKGLGFVWWAPDYVAFNGQESNEGSAFENLCTFDFGNKALPVFEVFKGH